jgi:ABC-type Na+ efflux pump permease subunit
MITARSKKVLVRLAIIVLPLIVIGACLFFFYAARRGREEIVHLDAENIQALRVEFNAAAGGTRLILLMSPT